MPNKKLVWCCGLKDGLKIVEPNENLARSYLEEAKTSLKRAHEMFDVKDFLWTTVIIYYAEYYALYSFLQRIGVKCENHFCSILAVSELLGAEKTNVINKHKNKRIDAQYYMKVVEESAIKEMLNDAKAFVVGFDNTTLNLSAEQIKEYRDRIKSHFNHFPEQKD